MEGTVAISGAQLLLFLAGIFAVMGAMAKIILADKESTIKSCREDTVRIAREAAAAVEKVEVDRNFWRDQALALQTGHQKTIENLVSVVGLIRDIVQQQKQAGAP